MPNIKVDEAVSKIFQIVDQRHKADRKTPFFFVVGAGISYPEIPLANEIEDHCKKTASEYGASAAPPAASKPIDTYSYWFGRAYPSAEGIQRYLRSLMQGRPISKANLRLAHLILDGTIARTVFTTNFDDMLTRALELLGKRPLVCDHPLTVGRMREDTEDPQIIHVHGSYWFYDCCNLKDDIDDRSGNAQMSGILDEFLRHHSPLVVGYSGWEDDVFMSALKRRLESGVLGTPIFWFGYRNETLESLPSWLLGRNDVYFVLPDEPLSSQVDRSTDKSAEQIELGDISDTSAPVVESKPAVLAADRVFDKLVKKFELKVPALTENPLAFYATQLRELLGTTELGHSEPDTFYGFHQAVTRVERARDAEAQQTPDSLQTLRDAMSKADYRSVITIAGQLNFDSLSPPARKELAFSVWEAAVGLWDNSAEEIAGYDLTVSAADSLGSGGASDLPVQERVAMALVNKGITLGLLGRVDEAIVAYGDVLRRFGDAPEPLLREQVAVALVNRGHWLGALGRSEEELATYDDVLRRFGDAPQPELREQVAKTLGGKGFRLGALGRSDEAIAAYDEILSRFGDAPEPELREQVAMALVNRGVRLGALGRSEEELATYDDVLRRFGEASEPALRERVARALLYKGVTLGALGRNDEAIAAFDDVLIRFGDASEPALREQVAKTLSSKGYRLGVLGRSDEAIAAYDDVLRRFGEASEPALREQVAKTLVSKGFRLGALGRNDEAIAVYDDVVIRFGDASEPALREQVAKTLSSKGYRLGVLGRSDEAIAAYDDVLIRFGDASEPALREQVAKSLVNKGFRLGALGRNDEAIAVYDDILSRFGDALEAVLREQVAKALVSKGLRLGALGRSDEAIVAYEDVLQRFGDAPEPAIREQVNRAIEHLVAFKPGNTKS